MYKSLCFTVPSAFAIIVTTLAASAQSLPPTAMASSPTYVPPKGTGVITGRVIYEGGQPAAGVVVVADMQSDALLSLTIPYWSQHGFTFKDKTGKVIGLGYEGPPPPGSEEVATVFAITTADGTYRLSGVTTAPYNILAAPPGTARHTSLQKPWDWVAVADEGVAAQEGQTVSAPDLVLTHGVMITGRVVEASTGKPLQGIVVETHGPERPISSSQTLAAVTDSDGRYSLRVVPGKSTLGLNGVRLDSGEYHDQAMKIDNALWSVENDFGAVVDSGTVQKKTSPVDAVSVETAVGQTHQVVFRLRRGKLQYRLKTQTRK